MSSVRGLYVIRGGSMTAAVATRPRRDDTTGDVPDDGRLATLELHFSRFDTWYEIDSAWEGRFMESIKRGAFRKTMKERGNQVKVLFNHGFDPQIGDKALGVPEVLEERDDAPYLQAPLLDTSYNRDLLPGLRAGAYGSSFMFEVIRDEWNMEPEKSDHNPEGLPERTIKEVRLFEAGPVTWPANPEATAGVRSGVDWYAEQLQRRDQDRYDQLARSFAAFRALVGLGTPAEGAASQATPNPATPASDTRSDRHVKGVSADVRRRRLQLLDLAKR
ncbi:MAG TPA: HK97 family phage prohead protease [Micromonosporaceae bacterium]